MRTKRMSLYIVSVVLLVIMILGSLGLATWALLSTKLDVSGNIGFQGTGDVLATISNGTYTGGTVTQKDGKTPMQQVDITATGPSDSTSWADLDLVIADKTEPLVISFSVTNNQPEGGKNLKIDVAPSITAANISMAVTTTEFGETNPVVIAPRATAHYSITFTVGETNTILSGTFGVVYNLVNTDDPISVAPLYTREGDYIYFGSYAKTIKANDVTVSSTADTNDYYTGSDGEKYVKIAATPYDAYTFSDGTEIADGTEYYFKVEPIKWRILSEADGTAMLLAEDVLEAQAYQAAGTSNNYANSDIRTWLNGTFLTTAFTAEEQGIIQTTVVDNSAATTDSSSNPYACENTEDKVYLLSYQDLNNTEYFADDAARMKAPTDYALATGAYYDVDYAAGVWWSRSPRSLLGTYAWSVYYDGLIGDDYVSSADGGAVPALTITL